MQPIVAHIKPCRLHSQPFAAAAGPRHSNATVGLRPVAAAAATQHNKDAAASTQRNKPSPAAFELQPAQLPRRRAVLSLVAASTVLLVQQGGAAQAAGKAGGGSVGDWSSPGLVAPVDPSQPKCSSRSPSSNPVIANLPTQRVFTTPSRVKVQVLAEGSAGPTAAPGDTVLVDYVLRRSNGYFIYATVDGISFQPKDMPVGPVVLRLGDGSVVPGLEEALLGARPGTKLRALVPPELGYDSQPGSFPQMPTFATQRQLTNHRSEPLLFEVQLLRVGGVK